MTQTILSARLSRQKRSITSSPPKDGFAVASLGQRPRIREIQNANAESAIQVRSLRAIESRFQRLFTTTIESLGRCPRLI
jgi:hypothetical protein